MKKALSIMMSIILLLSIGGCRNKDVVGLDDVGVNKVEKNGTTSIENAVFKGEYYLNELQLTTLSIDAFDILKFNSIL